MIGINLIGFGSKIHIKKKNRGKFTDFCGGKVTDECIQRGKNSKNPKIRKRATFAANARAWSHKDGDKIHKPFGHRSILDNGWRTTKQLKDKKIPIGGDGIPGIKFYDRSTEDNPIYYWDYPLYKLPLYDKVVQEVKNILLQLNKRNIGIKYLPEKSIKLTHAGKLTGAEFSTNVLDSLAKYGYKVGLPINQAIGLAAQESALGSANKNGYTSLKNKGVIYGSSLISNWSHGRDNPMRDLLITSEIKAGVRNVKKYGRNKEITLSDEDKKKVEPYLKLGMLYAKKLTNKMDTTLNVLEHGFRLFKSGNYNRKDPNHTQDVINSGNAVLQSPEFLLWWNTLGKKWYGF